MRRVANKIRFEDCRHCVYLQATRQNAECRTCVSGENYEEKPVEPLEEMTLESEELDFLYELYDHKEY